MALATAITMVRNVELPAMQTPGLGSSFHRQTRKQPPKLEENAPKPRRKSPGHTPPSHHRNKTEKKSFELKFRKKSAPRDIRSSNRPTYPISKSPFSTSAPRCFETSLSSARDSPRAFENPATEIGQQYPRTNPPITDLRARLAEERRQEQLAILVTNKDRLTQSPRAMT